MNEKKKRRVTLLGVVKILFTVSLIVIVLFPLVWMAVGSFKMEKEILGYPPTVFGTKYTLKSFQRIFKTIPMAAYIKNTVIFAGGSTFLAVLFDSLTGYAFARLNFKGKDILFMLVLLTMMVPFQVMMIPLFLESNLLGLLDTYGGLILPKATSAFGIFMMEFGIFAKIMFPLVIPGVLTLAIFHLMQNWNDLLYPLMMTSSTRMRTLSAGLALFVGEHATTYYGPQLAGALLSVLPLLVIYIFFQKYFIASVATSGMKD